MPRGVPHVRERPNPIDTTSDIIVVGVPQDGPSGDSPGRAYVYARDLGGVDTISGRAGSDIILGGHTDDTLHGDDSTGSSGAGDLDDVIFGDNSFGINWFIDVELHDPAAIF